MVKKCHLLIVLFIDWWILTGMTGRENMQLPSCVSVGEMEDADAAKVENAAKMNHVSHARVLKKKKKKKKKYASTPSATFGGAER